MSEVRATISIDVVLSDGATVKEAAEQLFNLACDDPEDDAPAIAVVEGYDYVEMD